MTSQLFPHSPSDTSSAATRGRRGPQRRWPRPRGSLALRLQRVDPRGETGAATAEYAIATMAAVGFAGLLVVIMRSDEVRSILTDLVHRALTYAG